MEISAMDLPSKDLNFGRVAGSPSLLLVSVAGEEGEA